MGAVIKKLVRHQLMQWWSALPHKRGDSLTELIAYGYPLPFLRPYLSANIPTAALMPAKLGVINWPYRAPNASCLVLEGDWPVRSGGAERVLLIHALEHAQNASDLMNEVARVLTPQGRLIVVVPHRHSLWARADQTPFGHGQPYTLSQLNALLREHDLTPLRHRRLLLMPPSSRRFWLNAALAIEIVGQRWFPGFGGLLMVEATKQVVAMKPKRVTAPVHGLLMPGQIQAAGSPTAYKKDR